VKASITYGAIAMTLGMVPLIDHLRSSVVRGMIQSLNRQGKLLEQKNFIADEEGVHAIEQNG
jgi:hypothetical protein